MDIVIPHWLTMVEANQEGTERLVMSIRDLAVYFYAGNGIFASTQPERLQRAFNLLTGLFEQVFLRTNTWKTVSITFQPFHAPGRMLVMAYERQTTGTGPFFCRDSGGG